MRNGHRSILLPGFVMSCIQANENSLIVNGDGFVYNFEIDTCEYISSVRTYAKTAHCELSLSKNSVMVSTEDGICIFSLPNLEIEKRIIMKEGVRPLLLLKNHNKFLLGNDCLLKSYNPFLDLITTFKTGHKGLIQAIAATSDEQVIFTTGYDQQVLRWNPINLEHNCQASIEEDCNTIAVHPSDQSIFVGTRSGKLVELSVNDLSIIRKISVHNRFLNKALFLKGGLLATCSKDGLVKFVDSDFVPLKVVRNEVINMTQLSDGRFALACGEEGVQIMTGMPELGDSIMLNLVKKANEIRKSSSDRLEIYIELVRKSLIDLINLKSSPSFFKGTLKEVQLFGKCISANFIDEGIFKGNFVNGRKEGRIKEINKNYILERDYQNGKLSSEKAKMYLSDLRLWAEGTLSIDSRNPLKDLKVELIRKGKVVWEFEQVQKIKDNIIRGKALIRFSNGVLYASTINGEIWINRENKCELMVDKLSYDIKCEFERGILIDSERNYWELNFNDNIIIKH